MVLNCLDKDALNPGCGRAKLGPVNYFSNRCGVASDHGFDAAINTVANPTGNA
jgi:hypothetical protein